MTIIDDRTLNLDFPKPHADNLLQDDVDRLREALDGIDAELVTKIPAADIPLLPVSGPQADADAAVFDAAKAYADGLVVGLWDDRGSFDASVNAFPSSGGSGDSGAILKGDIWTSSSAGLLGGMVVEVGDNIRALVDDPGQSAGSWTIVQANIGYLPENAANKDTGNGYPGLSGFALKLKSVAGAVTSLLASAATAARTWTFPDKDGTVAMMTDITAANAGALALAGGTMSGPVNESPPPSLASAATVNIGAASSNIITITGTTAITSLGAVAAGARRVLVFAGALTLTHNAASLLLPGGGNVVTAAGDSAEFLSMGAGAWRCLRYVRAASMPATQTGVEEIKGKTIDGLYNTLLNVPMWSFVRAARAANSQLVAADKGRLIDITGGTFVQTFAAVSALGDGWWCWIRNSGTGDVTIDPAAAELIDGLSSFVMYPGECRLVQCDGAALRSVVINAFTRDFSATGIFVLPPGYKSILVELWGAGGGGNGGQRGPSGSNSNNYSGGAGGAAGGFTSRKIKSSSVPSVLNVSIGAGGAGGAAAVVDFALGGVGGNGGPTIFGSLAKVQGGSGGGGGGDGYGDYGAGGGSGAWANFLGELLQASSGGRIVEADLVLAAGGARGLDGAAGGNAIVVAPGRVATGGGGGGGASKTGNGGNGGNAGVASGGGGGGVSLGFNSGAGGTGGGGYARISGI